MSENEKENTDASEVVGQDDIDIEKMKSEAAAGEKTAGAAGAENKADAEDEDDNISWDDAFEEEAKLTGGPKNDLKAAPNNLSTGADKSDDDGAAVKKDIKKVDFSSFDESDKTSEPPKNLDFILDIPLTISVELGRTKMVINDMLQLGQGSVIELAKLAGEPLDIYVNGKLMARGEVVLVNDKFGVRLTDIISPAERVKKL